MPKLNFQISTLIRCNTLQICQLKALKRQGFSDWTNVINNLSTLLTWPNTQEGFGFFKTKMSRVLGNNLNRCLHLSRTAQKLFEAFSVLIQLHDCRPMDLIDMEMIDNQYLGPQGRKRSNRVRVIKLIPRCKLIVHSTIVIWAKNIDGQKQLYLKYSVHFPQ